MLLSRPCFPQMQDFEGVGYEAGSLLTCWDTSSAPCPLLAPAGGSVEMGMWEGIPC